MSDWAEGEAAASATHEAALSDAVLRMEGGWDLTGPFVHPSEELIASTAAPYADALGEIRSCSMTGSR